MVVINYSTAKKLSQNNKTDNFNTEITMCQFYYKSNMSIDKQLFLYTI